MSPPLHILHLEDSPDDAELIRGMLEAGGVECTISRVSSREAFLRGLTDPAVGLIISDFTLPAFDGRSALRLAREKAPHVPFIFVSGTIGEESAIQSLVDGATDYVLKHRMDRLLPAVRRAMNEVRDRESRREAEQALRDSEERFRLISENVEDLIAVLDLRGKRIYNSPSYRTILGEPETLRGTDSFEAVHPADRERMKSLFDETVKTGRGHRAEFRLVGPGGRLHHIESQGSVIRDASGNVVNVIVVSRDITEKRFLEQQLLRSQRLESLGTLASGIAHDLNNVLSPVLLSIELLKRAVPGESGQQTLVTLEHSVQRGREIIRQILTFGRGITGERGLLHLRSIVNETLAIISPTFSSSITLRLDFPHDSWAVDGDATELHQLIMNLCVNARDAMPEGGTLRLSLANVQISRDEALEIPGGREGRFLLLGVDDTGTGMPAAVMQRMFDPFFTTKPAGKGTGLGLSAVQTIVRNHGGFIGVSSEPGKGTGFRIYLRASTGTEGESTAGPELDMATGKGELVLLIDDEASICEITKQTLDAFGYRTITAGSGAEGIALYASNASEVALIITDVMMPGLDGEKTIRVLRSLNPDVKIIGSSGLISTEGRPDATSVDGFIAKPYTAAALLSSVSAVIHGRADVPVQG